MRNEWLENMYSNRMDEERQSLVKDKLWYDEVMESRENVRCAMCSSYVYREDSVRINNITICKQCQKGHGMK